MTQKIVTEPEFPGVDEIKYLNIAMKKSDCAVFTHYVPFIFVNNPKKINLRSLQVASGMGMIYFRTGAEDKARKIGNLFTWLDFHYTNFLEAGLVKKNEPAAHRSSNVKPSGSTCTELFIPTGIEPHDGIEYILMQKGLKHVALFEHSLPIEFLTNPLQIDMDYIEFKNGSGRIYYTAGHEVSARELKKEMGKSEDFFKPDHIRRVGRILGYQHTDIELFIEYCNEHFKFYA